MTQEGEQAPPELVVPDLTVRAAAVHGAFEAGGRYFMLKYTGHPINSTLSHATHDNGEDGHGHDAPGGAEARSRGLAA